MKNTNGSDQHPLLKPIWVPTAQAYGDVGYMRRNGMLRDGRKPPTLEQILAKWQLRGYFPLHVFASELGAHQYINIILCKEPDRAAEALDDVETEAGAEAEAEVETDIDDNDGDYEERWE